MQPFTGLRVLDLTHVFAGPFCAYQLGVLGADVIKIEPVDQPDMTRYEGADPTLNAAGMGLSYQAQAAGKRTLAVNLKEPAGRDILDRLVAGSDVLVQNYSRRCQARLGLEYDRLAAINPGLIYCVISGFGQTGPKADDPAYDAVIQAFAGVMTSNGESDQPPLRIGPAVIDYGTGAQAALAISAALYGRAQTGQGRFIDVAMTDAAMMLMTSHTVTALATGQQVEPHGNTDPSLAGYCAYDTAEGTLMVGAFSNRQMAVLMRVLGDSERADAVLATPRADIASRAEEDRAWIAQVLLTRTAQDWETYLNAHHVPAARVRTLPEALATAQRASRPVVQTPTDGTWPLPVAGFCYDHGSPTPGHAPRAHGADSRAVLDSIGISEAEYAALAAAGVVAGR